MIPEEPNSAGSVEWWRRAAEVPSSKAVARTECFMCAKCLKLRSLGRRKHRVQASLSLPDERVEAGLHLPSNTTKVLGLSRHD